MSQPVLSIVIPAYNEEAHIEAVVTSLLSQRSQIVTAAGLADLEILVVNDGSTDTTGLRLIELSEKRKGEFRVITHPVNRGYGAALKTGLGEAKGSYLSFMDADGTINPESFVAMYQALQRRNADMAVGTRFGDESSQMPFIRKIGNRFFAGLLTFLSGERVEDSASGMRLFRREIVPQLLPLPDGLHFTPAMSTKAIHEQLKIVEVPIPYSERHGKSKLNPLPDGMRFLKIIVGTVLMYNPFKVFLLFGLFAELIAAALLSGPIYAWVTQEQVRFTDYIYRSIGALYFFTAGIQIVLFGVLARFLVSTFFKRYESGQFIHQLNSHLRLYDRMGGYGLVVLIVGIFVNALYLGQYLYKGGLEVHWGWLLLAAGTIIVGLQMVITGVVMRLIKDIKAARGVD